MEIFLLTFPGFREGEKIGTKPQMRKIVEMPQIPTKELLISLPKMASEHCQKVVLKYLKLQLFQMMT
jgi:hypothetical protein